MAISTRSFDTMVESVLTNIVQSNIGITDISKGSVIRTIVESILTELDIQYYQIAMAYDAICIDTAIADDLDRVVSILGVVRNPATRARGVVTFSRSSPAPSDILIPIDTIISTHESSNGTVIEFRTLANAIIRTGETSVNVNVEALEPQYLYLGIGLVNIINDPIINIESVSNANVISGGTDDETDDTLRSRSKLALSQLGKGTLKALTSAILDIDQVQDVLIIDQSRGVGTADVVVQCSISPVTEILIEQINTVIADTKPCGVDIDIVYPDEIVVNITVTTSQGVIDTTGNAILEYFNTLGIGQPLMIKQMERFILNAYPEYTLMDVTTTAPNANVTISATEVLKPGVITINNEIWIPS